MCSGNSEVAGELERRKPALEKSEAGDVRGTDGLALYIHLLPHGRILRGVP